MTFVKTNKRENFMPTLFTEFFDNAKFAGRNWLEKEFGQSLPAVNIKESNRDFSLDFAAPGFKKEDFKVSVEQNVLNISAEKSVEKSDESERFTRREFSFDSFSRSFTLPKNVKVEGIDAKYNDGILKLSIPKNEETAMGLKKDIKVA